MNGKYPLLRTRLQGDLIDRMGVSIYQLGRFLQSSQELVNMGASHAIKREIPLERYTTQPYLLERRYRRLFFQGHLAAAKQGSLDVLINIVAQPELRAFLLSDDFRAFGISVLANIFTSTASILFRGKDNKEAVAPHNEDKSLAIQLIPHLEKITRCITPRGGIERIELETEESDSYSKLRLVVDRGSREKLLDFAQTVQPQPISMAGEIRSVDLDRGTAIIADAISGERYELEESDNVRFSRDSLGRRMYIKGRIASIVRERGGIGTKIEVISMIPLEIDDKWR